jgi:hypothetical protein
MVRSIEAEPGGSAVGIPEHASGDDLAGPVDEPCLPGRAETGEGAVLPDERPVPVPAVPDPTDDVTGFGEVPSEDAGRVVARWSDRGELAVFPESEVGAVQLDEHLTPVVEVDDVHVGDREGVASPSVQRYGIS